MSDLRADIEAASNPAAMLAKANMRNHELQDIITQRDLEIAKLRGKLELALELMREALEDK